MLNIPYQKTKYISITQKILNEGEKIYPISKEIDEKCLEHNKIDNWANIFYNKKKGIIRKRYIELLSKTENNKFFEALNYEYGINNYPLDLNKAYQIYKIAAETSNDCLSMYRLYRIYKNEYKKFNFSKRNNVLEKYYFFKCCAYLPNLEIKEYSFLYKKFDIIGEMIIILDNDPKLSIFDKFFKHLKKYYKIYNIKLSDLMLIPSVIKICYCPECPQESVSQLYYLSEQNNLEAIYKLLCLDEKVEREEEKYKILYQNNYYRSFLDYALFLYSKGDKIEAINILKIAIKNGHYSAITYYLVIFFEINDFENIMKSPKEKNEFLFIIGCLIDNLIVDDLYSFYEYIYIRQVCIKHFNFKKEFQEYFEDYTKEIVDFLINITKGPESETKKNIKKYYKDDNYFKELYFVCGILYYYGVEGILEKNYKESLCKIKIAYDYSDSKSYKRYNYIYIYKNKEKILNINNKNINYQNQNNIKDNKEFNEIKNNLFKMYYNEIYDQENEYLSSSYYYYLSKLYNKKIGNNGDILMEYIYMNKAANYNDNGKKLRLNSFLVYYKRYKAKMIMKEKNKDEYYEKIKNIKGYMEIEGYGEDGLTCPICYENKKSTICLPCKHFFCPRCLKLIEKKNCSICRTVIVMTFDIQSKKEILLSSK